MVGFPTKKKVRGATELCDGRYSMIVLSDKLRAKIVK